MFEDLLLVEWVNHRQWRVAHPLRYVTKGGIVHEVPAGFVTDFASIPRMFRWLCARDAELAMAATLHDWLIRNRVVSDGKADQIFFEALKHQGVYLPWIEMRPRPVPRWKRWILYFGVRLGSLFRNWSRKHPDFALWLTKWPGFRLLRPGIAREVLRRA